MATPKHFLDLDQVDPKTLRQILDRGKAMKKARSNGGHDKPLGGKTLAMIFEKPSTRTRVSFEVGMRELGGQTIMLGRTDTQLGRGETIADTARVLSRYVDIIMMRTTVEEKLLEMAKYATVPVINGLTDRTHPCQLMADVMTYEEHRGPIQGGAIAWSGDGNNMATSWIHAAVQADSGEFPGGVGQETGEIVHAHGRHRARRRELAAQLIEIGLLAADPDGDRDRHRQQAGILGAEEDVEEARPGVGGDQDPLALGEARADQAAGGDLGALADLAPGEG
jgi:Aspartate/ornithine carbamoyltransferase, carbamoyl-P binding domain